MTTITPQPLSVQYSKNPKKQQSSGNIPQVLPGTPGSSSVQPLPPSSPPQR